MSPLPGPGSPPWRLLLALTALVVVVHVMVLQASTTRTGTRMDTEGRMAKAFTTRSIEAAPPPVVTVTPPAPKPVSRPALPKPIKPAPSVAASPPTPEIESNTPVAAVDSAPPAIDSIATEGLAASSENPASTPTAAEPVATQAQPAQATSTLATTAAALPPGPKVTAVTAVSLPPSVRMEYKMVGTSKGLNYQANSEMVWSRHDSQYDAYIRVSAFLIGARTLTSAGTITPIGLAPTRFADKFRSEQAAHFEADKGKITFSANTPDMPWMEGAQDRVSVFMQLAGILAAKPADFPAGSEITLYTAGPRNADNWTFTVEAEETLNLPRGDMRALKVTRKPRGDYDQTLEIWYAPSLGYLPVRNRVTLQNGDFIDQQLVKTVRPE